VRRANEAARGGEGAPSLTGRGPRPACCPWNRRWSRARCNGSQCPRRRPGPSVHASRPCARSSRRAPSPGPASPAHTVAYALSTYVPCRSHCSAPPDRFRQSARTSVMRARARVCSPALAS
jgi:hypothetical protein